MQITITFINKFKSFDLQLNPDMKIKDALEIIEKNLQFHCSQVNFLFSKRRKEMISCEYTFQDAKIYSGDCLCVRED